MPLPSPGCPGPGYLKLPNTLQHLLVLLRLHLEGLTREEVWEVRDTRQGGLMGRKAEPWL